MLVLVLVLFLYTLGLRMATVIGERRRERLDHEWRSILAASMLSADDARNLRLPACPRHQRVNLLEIWNRSRDTVQGSAADNLIILGHRIGMVAFAKRLLAKHRVQSRILAVQTLGHMRHGESWPAIVELLRDPHMALSITAAAALADIDPGRAVNLLVPMIAQRRDWPRTRVSRMLRSVGSDLVSE
ncbi:MAG TPA: HEAT repeat domain-containing protein, partial [Woeseiaceae bacterium]|nr:HEAT repeat domain-containing protein [Woeseiaceae bacterium]